MQRTLTRALLVLFGLVWIPVGLWAVLWPSSFYADFPAVRTGWVAMDGPFNQHLLRDFGGLVLALGATLIGAALIGTTAAARVAAVAALLYNVPHFVYHVGHVHQFDRLDQILIVSTTAAGAVVPLVVLVLPSRRVPIAGNGTTRTSYY